MRVLIRTDSSQVIGSGHLMRCLALAGALREAHAEVVFLSRELPGNSTGIVRQQGFELALLPHPTGDTPTAELSGSDAWLGVSWQEDAAETTSWMRREAFEPDWLIIDHYGLDHRWESALRAEARRLMVIDDLIERVHDCDLLLDQNGPEASPGRVPVGATTLLGPRYALLRTEFYDAVASVVPRAAGVNRVLVSFGGADPDDQTSRAVRAVREALPDAQVDVVLGANNPRGSELSGVLGKHGAVTVHPYVENMAELMLSADLAIGAAGTTAWERCILGLPAVMVSIAENQRRVAENVSGSAAGIDMGMAGDMTSQELVATLRSLADRPQDLESMSRSAIALMGGAIGGVGEVVSTMKRLLRPQIDSISLRALDRDDLATVLEWRNSPRVRSATPDDHVITWDEHVSWFDRQQAEGLSRYLVVESDDVPIGVVYFTAKDADFAECEWGFYLSDEYAGRGLGLAAVYAGLEDVFTIGSLQRVTARVRPENATSAKMHAVLGFTPAQGSVEDDGLSHFALDRSAWESRRMAVRKRAFAEG